MVLLQNQRDVVSCKYLWREKFADSRRRAGTR